MQLRTLAIVVAALLIAATASAAPQPLVFEPLRDANGFATRGAAWSAQLRADGAAIQIAPAAVVSMRILGARGDAALYGEAQRTSVTHQLLGNDASQWRHGVPHFGRVRATAVLPGIDVVYYGNPERLETDFEVAPGADPAAIALAFDGADALRIDASGALVIRAGDAELRQSQPVAYQQDGDARREVSAHWTIGADGHARFALGDYDRTRAIVIDPVLSYSTYLGGGVPDFGRRIVADALGNSWVTGRTLSTNFPIAKPLQATNGGGAYDAFVSKYDPQGTLLWSTYFGGSGEDWGYDVDVDAQGYLYFVGRTDSPNLPVVRAFQPALAGDTDCFLAKLLPDGSAFVYLTYLGATGHERPRGVAADDRGRLVAAGFTSSANFPLVNAIQSVYGGGDFDAWVGIVSPFGDRLEFSTLLGGAASDVAVNVEVDAAGRPVVTGFTDSANFPIANAVQSVRKGVSDAFVARLDPVAHALSFSTYLGGSGNGAEGDELGVDVDLDAAGNIYVAGRTRSTDFPIVAPLQGTLKGSEDAFVTKLAPGGTPILYSTYLGGTASDEARALTVDANGLAFVTGRAGSADFPLASPVQPSFGGGEDAFVSILSANGATLFHSTYVGGSGADDGFGIAIDAADNVFITGETNSANFPTLHAAQPAQAGHYEAFATKILQAPEVAVRLAPPAGGGSGARLTVQLLNGSLGAKTVELKLWLEGPSLPPLSMTSVTAPRITIAAGATQNVVADLPLPASVAFPGASVGARLLDGNTGEVISESVCKSVPCH